MLMLTTILSDFSRVIFNPKDKNYTGTLNGLYKELLEATTPFNFFDYFEFNEDILDLYSSLKDRYLINVFTTGTIQSAPEVRQKIGLIFDNIFSAEEYQLDKKQPEAYLFIAKKLNKGHAEIIYIDDEITNIQAAKKAGLAVILYQDFGQLKSQLAKILEQ